MLSHISVSLFLCHNDAIYNERDSMRKHNLGQNLKLQSTGVTLKIRSMSSKSYTSLPLQTKYQCKFDENPSSDTAPKMLIFTVFKGWWP